MAQTGTCLILHLFAERFGGGFPAEFGFWWRSPFENAEEKNDADLFV